MRLLAILTIVLMANIAQAAPYLVSDPVDTNTCGAAGQPNCPTKATCYEDNVVFASDVDLEADLSLRVDLAGRPPGQHEYRCVYIDQFGGVSLQSNPTRLGSAPPLNLRVMP